MTLFKLETIQCFPIDINQAWDFFSNPRNLRAITPSHLGFEITSELPNKAYPGLIITYRIKPLFNIPVNWVTEITKVSEPEYFVDEQRFGPYLFWHHTHFFEPIDGGVKMRDQVYYYPKPPILGGLINALIVKRQLNQIFDYRRNSLVERFGELPCPSLSSEIDHER